MSRVVYVLISYLCWSLKTRALLTMVGTKLELENHGEAAYRTLSTASQASPAPSNPHPSGPKSHSAQINHLTFPFAPGPARSSAALAPGVESGSTVDASRRE